MTEALGFRAVTGDQSLNGGVGEVESHGPFSDEPVGLGQVGGARRATLRARRACRRRSRAPGPRLPRNEGHPRAGPRKRSSLPRARRQASHPRSRVQPRRCAQPSGTRANELDPTYAGIFGRSGAAPIQIRVHTDAAQPIRHDHWRPQAKKGGIRMTPGNPTLQAQPGDRLVVRGTPRVRRSGTGRSSRSWARTGRPLTSCVGRTATRERSSRARTSSSSTRAVPRSASSRRPDGCARSRRSKSRSRSSTSRPRRSSELSDEVRALAAERNAVILAHNYQVPEIQDLADFVGDSLGLSRQAAATDAEVIVFCGVHFMAETASILAPDKTVLIPDLEAGCSLADSITASELRNWKQRYPRRGGRDVREHLGRGEGRDRLLLHLGERGQGRRARPRASTARTSRSCSGPTCGWAPTSSGSPASR